MSQECGVCHGKMTKQLVTYSQFYKGNFIIVENVPAWVCEQCGDTLYDPETVDRLQKYIWSQDKPVRSITVPVFDLALAA